MSKTNPYFQSNRRGGSAIKQARFKADTSQLNQTPKMLIQNSADERLLRESKCSENIQLRQSPSFKLKNVRHVTPGNKDEVKRQLMYQETYARKTRISVLESFYHQIGTDEDVSNIKTTQQVKKNPVATPSSSQTTSVPKQLLETEDRDVNLEEMHFQFVEMQQKYKGWLENIERRSKINQNQ